MNFISKYLGLFGLLAYAGSSLALSELPSAQLSQASQDELVVNLIEVSAKRDSASTINEEDHKANEQVAHGGHHSHKHYKHKKGKKHYKHKHRHKKHYRVKHHHHHHYWHGKHRKAHKRHYKNHYNFYWNYSPESLHWHKYHLYRYPSHTTSKEVIRIYD